jgi:hypothetical protein
LDFCVFFARKESSRAELRQFLHPERTACGRQE